MKEKFPSTTTPHHAVLLFATSASVLAYEILLMRLLSIGLWHHFAYMVISLALLGFGGAGSLLFLGFERIRKDLDQWLVILAGAAAVSFSTAFGLSQKVGLDPLQLIWQSREWLNMLITYALMAVPFLLAGGIIGMILTGAGEQAHLMYAVDLLGAGCGALAIVPTLYLGPPWTLLPALGGVLLAGAIWCCGRMRRPVRGVSCILIAAGLVAGSYWLMPPIPRIHHTKALPMTLSFPDARIEAERVGPLGMIHVVGSSLIRDVPGLSLNFGLDPKMGEARLPQQKRIFLDGDALGPITSFTGELGELAYLDATTMALPYHIRHPNKVLVVGAGGGTDVLLGLRHQVSNIIALEANKQVAGLLTRPFAEFSGHLYSSPEVKLELCEARQFLHASNERFDLIQLSLLDSFVSSAGGLHSASESYLYTSEAFRLYLSRLTDSGIISITRWLKLPPRDSLRIVSTALSALKAMDLSDRADRHLLFIRSWKTSTILVSKSPFLQQEIERSKAFCNRRSFDVAFFAGMSMERANRYDVQNEPYYFIGAKALSGPEAKSFLGKYIFDVSPTTDDRPYFSHFFRWDKASTLFHHLRREWFPLIELGYVLIIATLVQAVIASGALILLPLLFLKWAHKVVSQTGAVPRGTDILGTLIYFGCIGLAFMFLEMALLPKYTLLLSHPIYSAAVVLSSILVFAGLGSMSVRRFQTRGVWFLWIPAATISIWVAIQVLAGDGLFARALAWPFWSRMALAILLISVLSFFMGWPFPSGLRVLARRFPRLMPWAWGINGCASVIGAVLGKYLAVSIGFRWLMFVACALYLLAVTTFYAWFGTNEDL
ncbi:MAG: hypothetical protein PVG99_08080 [Desulfobacteraceae bacterium]|jgi:spermidine synthase